MRILLVEDDQILGDGLQAGLSLEGHTVDWLSCGRDAEATDVEPEFDVVILDLGLPGYPGQSVLKAWRRKGIRTPVLVLTAYEPEVNCAFTLDMGADDYVTKPVALPELSARLRALQRRAEGHADNVMSHGDLTLDRARRCGYLAGEPLALSAYEYTVLEALMEHPGHPVSRETLESSLYGWEDGPESNSLEVLIHKLRRRLGREKIVTIRGIGYRLST